jgi:hypothetical protein
MPAGEELTGIRLFFDTTFSKSEEATDRRR